MHLRIKSEFSYTARVGHLVPIPGRFQPKGEMEMRKLFVSILVALSTLTAMPALSASTLPQGGQEDRAGWKCHEAGNRICGDDRWVEFRMAGAKWTFRTDPRTAAQVWQNAVDDPGAQVCLVRIRRAWGSIGRFRTRCA